MYFLSMLMIFVSSYLVLSVISRKTDRVYGFLYLLLIAFSQIILSFEVLSLFSLINRNNFLISNFIFLIVSCLLFVKSERKFYIPEIKSEINRIKNSFKLDKLLKFCGVCFCIFIIFQVITVLFYPVTFGDALCYYFTRALSRIVLGSFAHFVTPDPRELIMPVNMDILYSLHFLFFKSEAGTAVYSFVSYLFCINVIYLLIKEIGFSCRQTLWSIFVYSSFAVIAVAMKTPCGEIFASGLLIACIFLLLIDFKYKNNVALYFSSLSYALAVGVKTTAIMAAPSLLFIMFVFIVLYKPQNPLKKIMRFALFFAINFLIFSSYNYILNYIRFQNPVTNYSEYRINAFKGGVKNWYTSFLKYCLLIFDMSGIDFNFISNYSNLLQNKILALAGCPVNEVTNANFSEYFKFTPQMSILKSALGAVGFFVLLPSMIISAFINKNKKKNIIVFSFLIAFFINIAVISGAMVFTEYNAKYIITFVPLALFCLVYTYGRKRNIYKLFCCLLLFWYLVINAGMQPTELLLKNIPNINIMPKNEDKEAAVYDKMKNFSPGKIALIADYRKSNLFHIEKLYFDGFSVYKPDIETMDKIDLKDFDYIITNNDYEIMTEAISKTIRVPEFLNCIFLDVNQTVTDRNKEYPVFVIYKIPHEYFAQNGFQYLFETDKYIVLKNGAK